jgi:hypothetical protein
MPAPRSGWPGRCGKNRNRNDNIGWRGEVRQYIWWILDALFVLALLGWSSR